MTSLKHIMVVENESFIREIVKMCLQDFGDFTVTECQSGDEAIAKFVEVKPQLVFMDVMMPGINGIKTFEKIQALPGGKETPVVFVTARAHDNYIQEYLALGAAGVIAKPFDLITVAKELTAIWEKCELKRVGQSPKPTSSEAG
jgi:two-component system OmpR family response regulator